MKKICIVICIGVFSDIPDKDNNQLHITAIEKDEYFQYMIAVEQSLMSELATATFILLACVTLLRDLSYHEARPQHSY